MQQHRSLLAPDPLQEILQDRYAEYQELFRFWPRRPDWRWVEQFHKAPPLHNALGVPLRPVLTMPRSCPTNYEIEVIRGHIAFRPETTHDLFNLLAWHTWPLTKAALNLRQVLHYLAQLRRLYPTDPYSHLGHRIDRDRFMQRLAHLDEGGCVVPLRILQERADRDDRNVWRFRSPPGPVLRWFGHALLELAHAKKVLPRAYVLALSDAEFAEGDEGLARRVLCLCPSLQEEIAPLVLYLPPLERFFQESLRFAQGDPFCGAFETVELPWDCSGLGGGSARSVVEDGKAPAERRHNNLR